MTASEASKPQEPWDVEKAAHEAAMDADEVRYREALRDYMRAGRAEALRIRKGAA